MICIGNDVVDLRDKDCQNVLENLGFLDRVFTEHEKRQIKESENPEQHIWALWACKESAYKALRRLNPETLFSHKKFQTDKALERVFYEDLEIACKVIFSPNTIFAFAVIHGSIDQVEHLSQRIDFSLNHPKLFAESSIAVRKLATQLAQRIFSLPAETISVHKENDRSPPLLMQSELILSEAISLTHHGRYAAASIYNPY